MAHKNLKTLCCVFFALSAIPAFAVEKIKVTVRTNETRAVAIGFTVNNQEQGSLGKSYTGYGTPNKEYSFGYRQDSIFGENVSCGSLVLTQDSVVTLIKQDGVCFGVLN